MPKVRVTTNSAMGIPSYVDRRVLIKISRRGRQRWFRFTIEAKVVNRFIGR
jgi:hypothetical protein